MDAYKVALAIIKRGDGQILLTQRGANVHLPGAWEFPGGKMEAHESPEACALRECREECGIEVVVEGLLGEFKYRYPDRDIHFWVYVCRLNDDVAQVISKSHRWCPSEELLSVEFPEANQAIVRAWLDQL